jgi:O-antigen ligase
VTINLRYTYDDYYYTQYGLLKLGKFALYGFAGFLTVKAAAGAGERRGFFLSLVVSGLIVGLGLVLAGQGDVTPDTTNGSDPGAGYKASNAISVLAAMLACYICGVWLENQEKSRWRKWVMIVAMVALVLGSAVSRGRGGWIGGIGGFIYLVARRSFDYRRAAAVLAVPVLIFVLYSQVSIFQQRVQSTVDPGQRSLEDDPEGVGGVSLGSRPQEWADGIDQFRSPVFGTGFFHRGALSGIYQDGSHNFFLQMFMETGLPGGILMLGIFVRLWKITGSRTSRESGATMPVRAALIAGILGGMSGEYYYGGITLLGLFVVYTSCGSLQPLKWRRMQLLAASAEEEAHRQYAIPVAGGLSR